MVLSRRSLWTLPLALALAFFLQSAAHAQTQLGLTETPAGSGFFTATVTDSVTAVGSANADNFLFEVEGGDRVTVWVVTDLADTYPRLRLKNAGGTVLAQQDGNQQGEAWVQNFTITAPGSYTLTVYSDHKPSGYRVRADVGRGFLLEEETNNSAHSAAALTVQSQGGGFTAKAAGALRFDADYYSLGSLGSGNAVNLNLALPSTSTLTNGDVIVTLFKSGAEAMPLATTNAGTLNATVVESGDYFLRIAGETTLSGRALRFDGTDDSVSLGDPAALNITGDQTIELWLKPDDLTARRNPWNKAYGGEGSMTLETAGDVNYFYGTAGADNTPFQTFNSGKRLRAGQWNHIAVVRQLGVAPRKLYWYINGGLANSADAAYFPAVSSALNALIGQGYVGRFKGEIDEVRVWNVARTAAEVAANLDNTLTGSEAGLVGYYQFAEGGGATLEDNTPNNLDGTISGGPEWTGSEGTGSFAPARQGLLAQYVASISVTDATAPTVMSATPRMAAGPDLAGIPNLVINPANMTAYRGQNGTSFSVQVTGSTAGSLWGSGVFTDDSNVATAAVHAGLLAVGETGVVTVTMLPGQSAYESSTRNGVTSNSFGTFSGSYTLSAYSGAEPSSYSGVYHGLRVRFSEWMLPSTLQAPANLELRHAGVDGVLDTGDDSTYALTTSYTGESNEVYFSITDGPLQAGLHRLRVTTNVKDRSGNGLAGASDTSFTISNSGSFVFETRNNNTRLTAGGISLAPSAAFDQSFTSLHDRAAGSNPWGIKLLDLNGDNRPEAIVCGNSDNQLRVFPGIGDGSFGPSTTYAASSTPTAIELIDYDGDGDQDVVVTCYGTDRIAKFANPGDGTLVAEGTVLVGDAPEFIVKGRFNNDNIPDLAVSNFGTGTGGQSISILIGDGVGGFTESKLTPVSFRPYALAAGDLNGDGYDDLAAGDWTGDNVRTFLCLGNGTFGVPAAFDVDDLDPTAIALADFDHDGALDVAVATEYHDAISILKGNGDGTLQPYTTWGTDSGGYCYFLLSADIDQDGWADLVVPRSNGVSVGYNRQSTAVPNFTTVIRYTEAGHTHHAAVADVNLDNRPDLVVTEYNIGRLRTLVGNRLESLAPDATIVGLLHGYGRGQIGSDSDEDWFKFSVLDAQRIVLAVENPGSFTAAGLSFRIYDPAGNQIASTTSDTNGRGQTAPIAINAPGTYFVRVANSNNYRGEYQFRLSSFHQSVAIETETNDSTAGANGTSLTLGVGALTGVSAGYLSEVDTSGDYWSLGNLGAGANITLDLTIPATSQLSARMAIYKGTTQVAISDAGAAQLSYGITPGNEGAYYFRVTDGANTRGLHAEYQVGISVADPVAPTVTAATLPTAGSTISYVSSNFALTFSEDMLAPTVNGAAGYELRNAGPDNTFGNGDDSLYSVAAQSYATGLTANYSIVDGPLQPGNYRFTATTALTDKFANPLASPFVREFTVASVPGFVLESRSNDTQATATVISTSPNSNFSGTFGASTSTAAGAGLWGLKLLDLNGDGSKDAIAAKFDSAQLAVFLGNGDGTFAAPVTYAAGANPWDVELVDIDSDGDLDVAVSCRGVDQVRLYANPGNGTLVPGATITVGDGPVHMVTGRFNNDGITDLAVANSLTGTGGRSISLLLGNGAGGFTESKITVAGQTVQFHALAAGNFDGDANNLDDLAAGDYVSDDIAIFLNNGGTFLAPVFYPVDDNEPTAAAVADFDHDGNLDIAAVTEHHDYFSVLRGNGDGTFQPFTRFLSEGGSYCYIAEAADLNDDGWADLLLSRYGVQGLSVVYNRASANLNFSDAIRNGESGDTGGAVAAELNGDGRIDLVAASYNLNKLQVWLGDGSQPLAADGAIDGLRHGGLRGHLTTDSDLDWFQFTADDQDRLIITMESPGAPAASGRNVRLFDSSGVQLASVSGNSTGYLYWSTTLRYSGRFYLRVGANHGGTAEYRLRATLAKPPTFVEVEQNDSLAQTNTPPLALSGGQLTAKVLGITAPGDVSDNFNLGNLSSGTQVTVSVTATQLATDAAAARQATQLQHRWSFGEAAGSSQFLDSITGQNSSTLRGAGAVVGGGEVTLPGGSSGTAAYVDLANGILSSRAGSVTLEGWARINGSQNWSRLFDFGTGSAGELAGPGGSASGTEGLILSAQSGSTLTQNLLAMRRIGQSSFESTFTVPYTAGVLFHYAVVFEDASGAPGGSLRYYRNGQFVGSVATPYKPSQIVDHNNWLGRSGYTSESNLQGAYSEFRVWDGAFTDRHAQGSAAAGPDALPSAVPAAEAALPTLTLFRATGAQVAQALPGAGPLVFNLGPSDSGAYVVRVTNSLASNSSMYQFGVTVADITPPAITANSLPAQGSTVTFPGPDFTLSFSEDMLASTVNNLANFDLRSAGPNGTFGDGDDAVYALSLPAYTSGLTRSLHIVNGPLQPGAYRFTAGTGLKDLFLLPMAAAHVRQFTVINRPGFVTEDRDNGSLATADVLSGAAAATAGFDGSYAALPALPAGGNYPVGIVLLDLDADNDLDVVTANRDSDNVSVRLNGGAGNLGAVTNYPVGDGPHYLCRIDFDNDGDDDLVVPNAYSDNVTVLRNHGNGTLTTVATLAAGDHPLSSAKGDFNGDDNPDFVISNYETGANGRRLSVYLGDGSGGFVHSYLGNGLTPAWRPYHVAVGNFDGNAFEDIVATNYDSNEVLVFLATGAGAFAAPVRYATDRINPTGITVADFNGDFKLDLAVAYEHHDRVNTLLGNGDGSFQSHSPWYLEGHRTQYNLRAGDLNADGYPDLVAPRWGSLALRQNLATPALDFAGVQYYTESAEIADAAVGDLDGDGRRDIVTASATQSQVWVFKGQGSYPLNVDGALANLRHGLGSGQLDVEGEVDYFTFSARAGERIVVAAAAPGMPNNSGFNYQIYDSRNQNQLSSSGIVPTGFAYTGPYTVPYDGRFFIRVAPVYWSTAEYQFRVSIVDSQTQIEAELNNSIGSANALSYTTGAGTRSAKVFGHHAANDATGDFFRLGNLAEGTDISLTAVVPGIAAATAGERPPLILRHRWSFEEGAGATTFADSVGATPAQMRGSGGVVGGGAVSLPGGSSASSAYIDLPNGIASSRTGDATFEGWAANNGSGNWTRLFDFGNGTAGELSGPGGAANASNYLTLTAQIGSTTTSNRLEFKNGGSTNTIDISHTVPSGEMFHFAVVYDADGNGGQPLLRYYRNGILSASIITNLRLADLPDVNNWLGRSQNSSESNLSGAFAEFRVWDGAFTDSEAASSYAAGPSGLPNVAANSLAGMPSLYLYRANGTQVASAVVGSGPLHYVVGSGGADAYYFLVYHSARNLNSVYQVNAALTDSLPPQITGTNLPGEGATTLGFIDSFTLSFNEDLLATTVALGANYVLREAGPDTVLGSSDDITYAVTPTAYTSGLTGSYTLPDSLPPGSYRLTVSGLRDTYGTAMASPFVRNFVVGSVQGFTTASPGATANTAAALASVEGPTGLTSAAGRGRRTSSGDTDYWSFTAIAGQRLNLDVELVGADPTTNLFWRLDLPDNSLLWQGALGNDNQGGFATLTLPATGVYKLRITESNAWTNEYRFRISLYGATQPQLESEANNSIGSADPINLAPEGDISVARVAGIVHNSSDLDYFSLGALPAGKTVFLSAALPISGSFLPVVALYNSSGQFMSEVNGSTGDGSAEVRITQPDSYYLLVRSTGGTGSYMSQYVTEVQVHETSAVTIPNLQITGIVAPPEANLQSGSAYTYSFTVTNVGSADIPAQAWTDRLVLSQNQTYGDGDDIEVGVFPRNAALLSGNAYTVTGPAALPAGLVGDFRLIARTDIADQVDELVLENDNTTATANTFPVGLAPYPDIMVQNLGVTGPVGEVFTLSWDLANTGNASAPAGFKERVRVVNTTTGITLLDELRTPGVIAAAGSLARSAQVSTIAAGNYQVTITGDAENHLFEHDGVSHATAEVNSAATSFNILQYWSISATTPDSAKGSVTGGGSFLDGATVTVIATPNTATLPYQFVRWTSGGAFVSANPTYVFSASANRSLVAEFALATYQVAASVSPVGAGTVSGGGFYQHGSTATLTATPGAGYNFGHWEEQGANLGATTTLNLTVTGARNVQAIFTEANPTHVVTTATNPVGLGVTTGDGTFSNGQLSSFSAPASVTQGDTEYLFSQWKLNGVFFGNNREFSKTFSTLDNANMAFVAQYTSRSLMPVVTGVLANYANPIRAANDVRFTLTFDRPMNTAIVPTLALASANASVAASIPPGGTWLSATQFQSAAVSFGAGNGGAYQLDASAATDTNGRVMAAADVYAFDVDVTPPPAPVLALTSSTGSSATVNWNGYAAPGDINGFRLYLQTTNFTDITTPAVLLSVAGTPGNVRSYTFNNLQPDTNYYAALVAVDTAGNGNPAVTTLPIFLDSTVPPPVAATLTRPTPSSARVSWAGYTIGNLIGFQGFRVYREETSFSDVTGLTHVAQLGSNAAQHDLTNLDRTKTYYIAVVGYNRLNEFNPAVTPVVWTDPLAGNITSNLTIGAANADTTVSVLQSMVVKPGATLTILPGTTLQFASGVGLTIEGTLLAEGTALRPINLTSATDVPGGAPARGDWNGVTLSSVTNATRLSHVWTRYGRGLSVIGGQPVLGSLFAVWNQDQGLAVSGDANVSVANSYFSLNDIGVSAGGNAALTLTQSVIKTNTNFGATQSGTATLLASANWWGTTEGTEIAASVQGTVDTSAALSGEPVLATGVAATGGITSTGSRNFAVSLASANATSYRLSENSLFPGVLWTDVFPAGEVNTYSPYPFGANFLLSAGGGLKTVYAQFRSITGGTSAAIPVNVTLITDGPTISSFNLTDGQTLTRPVTVTGAATAPLGMQNIQFFIDDTLLAGANGGSLNFQWDIRSLTPGPYRAKLVARDNSGNISTREVNVNVAPTPPPAPVITVPVNNAVLTTASISVTGTAEAGVTVRLTRNGTTQGTTTATGVGAFNFPAVSLVEGSNDLIAIATDSIGSRSSTPVKVTLDSGPPAAVVLEEPPVYDAFRGLLLAWSYGPAGERPAKFRVLWHTAPFATPAQATGQSVLLDGLNYTLTSAPDGPLHIAVIGYDGAGNASPLSNVISYTLDRTSPTFSLAFDKSMPAGPGALEIVLTANEPLAATPLLTIRPNGVSAPISVPLTSVSATTYTASYNVTSLSARTGAATVTVTGSDLTGNTFTGTPGGTALSFDVTPPTGTLTFDQSLPIKTVSDADPNVPEDVNLSFTLTLSELPKPGTTPTITFTPPIGAVVTPVLTGSGVNWTGSMALTSSMGKGLGQLVFTAIDLRDNTGSSITPNQIEIYNTEHPSLPGIPVNLRATTLAGGHIKIEWNAVSDAQSYRLYREPGNTGVTPTVLVAENIQATQYTDQTLPVDGIYRYAVRAFRVSVEGSPSGTLNALSDRTPPEAPEDPEVLLTATGVQITFSAPSSGPTPHRYHLYRNGVKIRTVTTPQAILDFPSRGLHQYEVASADSYENESRTDPISFEFFVDAVDSLRATVREGHPTELQWVFTDSAGVGYNIYRNGVKQNAQPVPVGIKAFTDPLPLPPTESVEYRVTGVDNQNREGAPRTVRVLPVVWDMLLNADALGNSSAPLTRYFDEYSVTVFNRDATLPLNIGAIEVSRTLSGGATTLVTHQTALNIGAGANAVVDVPVPGAQHPLQQQNLEMAVITAPNEGGSTVSYERAGPLPEAEEPSLMLELRLVEAPFAGGLADVKVRIHNRGFTPADILLGRQNGQQPGDLSVQVRDSNGLELSRKGFNGIGAPGLVIRPNGDAYVTLTAGASVEVNVDDVLVPEALAASGSARFHAEISEIRTAVGTQNEQVSGPLTGSTISNVIQTPYFGTITTVKDNYAGDEDVVINGQSIDRATGNPQGNLTMKIGFSARGAIWYEEITSDADGNFSFTYTPFAGFAGELTIWGAHPEIYDVLAQRTIRVYRLYAAPSFGDIRMSKNDHLDFTLGLINPADLPLTGLQLQFSAYQLDVDGVTRIPVPQVTCGFQAASAITDIAASGKVNAKMRLMATADAPDQALVELIYNTAEGASAKFTGEVELLPAVPILSMTDPRQGYVDVTVNRGQIVSRQITLQNLGTRALIDVELVPPQNTPWMQLNLPANAEGNIDLPDLDVGASTTITVAFLPPEGTPLGYANDSIVVRGSNAQAGFTFNLFALVSSNLTGSASFHVDNILGQDVPNASVRVKNPITGTEIGPLNTNAEGEVTFADLPEGTWAWQVIAAGHSTNAGTLEITPDQTTPVEVTLNRSLVTVTFQVKPVPFTDRYEIVIEQTFLTFVPAPVMVITPPKYDFGNIQAGFETTVIYELKNHGLIKTFNVDVTGTTSGFFTVEPLIDFIPELLPQQTVQIPTRIRLAQNLFSGEAGGCGDGSGLGGFKGAQNASSYGGPSPTLGGAVQTALDKVGACPSPSNLTDFLNGIAAIAAMGANGCAASQKSGSLGTVAAAALASASAYQAITSLPSPLAPIASILGGLAGDLLQCGAGFFGSSGGGGSGPGGNKQGHGGYAIAGNGCFMGDTPVLLADGSTVAIHEVRPGAILRTGVDHRETGEVCQAYQLESEEVHLLRLRDPDSIGAGERILRVTGEHMIWRDAAGWTAARQLRPGDWLHDPGGRLLEIVNNDRLPGRHTVHTLQLKGNNTFYAGGVLVQDLCGGLYLDKVAAKNLKPVAK